MRYYLIAGEASGDIHASHLIKALKEADAEARFRCFGGDMMAAEGVELVQHYRDLAYMGFLPVLKHLPTILRGMKRCRQDILHWRPDALILVDYPGFNLKIARFIKAHSSIPVFYYISPKIWAWKEHRIKDIKRDIDCLLSILPFEKKFYEEKHHYPIYYVGNPSVDEVEAYLKEHPKAISEEGQGARSRGQENTESSSCSLLLAPCSLEDRSRRASRRTTRHCSVAWKPKAGSASEPPTHAGSSSALCQRLSVGACRRPRT